MPPPDHPAALSSLLFWSLFAGVIEFSRFMQNWGERVMQTLRGVSWKVNRPGHSDILCAKWKVNGESRWWNLSCSAVAGLWFFLRVLSRFVKLFKLKAVKTKQKSIWFGHFIVFLASLQEVTSSPSPVLMLPTVRYPRTARPSLPCISFSKISLFLKNTFWSLQIRALPAHLKSAASGIWQPYLSKYECSRVASVQHYNTLTADTEIRLSGRVGGWRRVPQRYYRWLQAGGGFARRHCLLRSAALAECCCPSWRLITPEGCGCRDSCLDGQMLT